MKHLIKFICLLFISITLYIPSAFSQWIPDGFWNNKNTGVIDPIPDVGSGDYKCLFCHMPVIGDTDEGDEGDEGDERDEGDEGDEGDTTGTSGG